MISLGEISQVKNTFIFFDDKFSLITASSYNAVSILPEWLDRILEIEEFRVIDRHGKKIRV